MSQDPGGQWSTTVGDGFLVDVYAARQAVATLTGALDTLEGQLASGRHRGPVYVGPDPVSQRVGENITEMMRRANAYVDALARQVRDARDGLAAQIAEYERVERENRDGFA